MSGGTVRAWLIPARDARGGLVPEHEADAVARWVDALEALLTERGVPLTPLILLRLEDVMTSWLAARRIESILWESGVFAEAPPKRGQEADAAALAVSSLVDHAGKARERTRKAMKDLEEACEKLGAPIDQGLADAVKPLLEQSAGVLDDALAFERRKREPANGVNRAA
jgi:hypothetical protein